MNSTIALWLVQDGATTGAIYALLALALLLLFAVTRVIFVPQGDFVAYAALTLAMLQQGLLPGTVWLLAGAALIAAAIDAAFGLDTLSFTGNATNAGSTTAATLTMGKRIADNLYLSYERSLAGTLNTVSIFHDVSRRVTLRARGQRERGRSDLHAELRLNAQSRTQRCRRRAEGVMLQHRLNAVEKWLMLLKPQASATSVTPSPPLCSSRRSLFQPRLQGVSVRRQACMPLEQAHEAVFNSHVYCLSTSPEDAGNPLSSRVDSPYTGVYASLKHTFVYGV